MKLNKTRAFLSQSLTTNETKLLMFRGERHDRRLLTIYPAELKSGSFYGPQVFPIV